MENLYTLRPQTEMVEKNAKSINPEKTSHSWEGMGAPKGP
jgi:hypothetical protein